MSERLGELPRVNQRMQQILPEAHGFTTPSGGQRECRQGVSRDAGVCWEEEVGQVHSSVVQVGQVHSSPRDSI